MSQLSSKAGDITVSPLLVSHQNSDGVNEVQSRDGKDKNKASVTPERAGLPGRFLRQQGLI